MNENVEKLIQRHEGLRHFVYKCPTGRYTIGFGRNVDVAGGKGLSNVECEYLLQNDIQQLTSHLTSAVPVFEKLNEARQAALISMGYILGMRGLMKFKRMLKAVNSLNFDKAAKELLDSKMAQQLPGRSKELAQMLCDGRFMYK